MAKDSDQVRIGYAGSVYVADVGTTAPTSPFAAWGSGWTELGHISEDGVTEGASQDISEFFAWGYPSAPVRTQVTSEECTFAITFLETKAEVLSLFFQVPLDDFTNTAAAGADPQYISFTKAMASTPDIRALGIDVVDGTRMSRIIIPRAQINDRGDLSYRTDELLGYQVTFRALLASDGTTWDRMWTNVALPA